MQDIVFYVAAKETHGIVRDSANANPLSAPDLVIGVSVCLKIRLFAACNVATPYPVASFVGVANWTWHMGADFDRDVPSLLVADAEDISVRTVTDTVDGQTMSFTEFSIPISDMDTQELSAWIGNARKRSGLVGELIGYDSEENAVFVLQVDDFTIWNRVDGLAEPTTIDREVPTRSETLQMIQTAVSSSAETKQDKLTSANAGTNISINENGVISNIYSLPSATNSVKGGVSLATDAETIAGSNAAKAITPASFKAALTGSDQIVEHSALKAFRQIDNLGSASTVSLASGRAYKLVATSGSHFLTVSDVPAGKYGMDAHLELFVGATALVHTSAPLILMDALVPNVVNDCVIKFRDGTARMFVEDHAYGYVVTVAGGTEGTQLEGSLYYGLTGSTQSYVVFANSLNGQTVTFPEGTTVNRIVNVVGNGYTQTILSGGVSCTSKTTFSNLGMNGVSVLGGTATLGDVFIDAGSTVSVNGGNLAIEKVTGSGGTIDLGGTNLTMFGGYVSGLTIANGSATGNNGGGLFYAAKNTVFTLSGCHLFGGIAAAGGAISLRYDRGANVTSCSFDGNTATKGNAIALSESSFVNLSGCLFGSGQDICFRGGTPSVNLYGTNAVDTIRANGGSGTVTLTSGAILDLTGNTNATPVNPGGCVTFEQGGATVYPSAGQASAYTLGGMTVPQIGNTNVVTLVASSGGSAVIPGAGSGYANGCIFNGSNCELAAIQVGSSATLTLSNCEVSGGLYRSVRALKGCTINLNGGNTIEKRIFLLQNDCAVNIKGSNSIGGVYKDSSVSTGIVTIGSGASITLADSIEPGGGITFASGGASVNLAYIDNLTIPSIDSAGVANLADTTVAASGATIANATFTSGTLDMVNVFIPQNGTVGVGTSGGLAIENVTGNGGTIDLGGTNVTVSSGCTAYASGCIFSGGSANFGGTFYVVGGNLVLSGVDLIETTATSRGGAIAVLSGGNAELTDCTISGARASVSGKGMYVTNGGIQLTNCTIEDTNGDSIMLNGSASADISGCTITSSIRFGNNNSNTLSFAGNNTIELVYATGGVSGYITISSGAIVDLTGNTNETPIVPGGSILISSGGISIIDSVGSTHEFQNLAITGSTINKLGQILGATVSIPAAGAGVGPWIVSTTLGSSTFSATAEAQELAIEGGLVSIQEL